MRLCPFGVEGAEPLAPVDGWIMGIREAVWRGYLALDRGKEIYPAGNWDEVEQEPPCPDAPGGVASSDG